MYRVFVCLFKYVDGELEDFARSHFDHQFEIIPLKVGGNHVKLQPLYRHFFVGSKCLIFVLDSCDVSLLEDDGIRTLQMYDHFKILR